MSRKYSKAYIKNIAEELTEELRECENGTVTSTSELAKQSAYDDLDDTDLFELHIALMCTAKANKIRLDMSEHEDKAKDLPYNLTFTVHNQKAQIRCPRCGSTDTARYIYGYPLFNQKMQKKLNEGKLVLGGCCINAKEVNGQTVEMMPSRRCNECHKDFGSPPILLTPKKDLVEDYRDIVESVVFSIGGYLYGHTDITIKKNEDGAIVSVLKFPDLPENCGDVQITTEKWNKIINTLYEKLSLHEWKKSYVDPLILDGTQWSLDVNLTNRRARHYHGSNAYPPYWNELKRVFRQFAKL
ncbi:MAG: hypothetical protein Q4D24_04545 [Erysipelotrichaceae bacterium]|nr:hypothetical protein [Erysipelotrichaceae bacterium]